MAAPKSDEASLANYKRTSDTTEDKPLGAKVLAEITPPVPATSDAAAANTPEKALETTRTQVSDAFKSTVEPLAAVRKDADEIVRLGREHKPDDRIKVVENGTTREMSVDDRAKELKARIAENLNTSIKRADEMPKEPLTDMISVNALHRTNIAEKYGFTIATSKEEQLRQLEVNKGKVDPATFARDKAAYTQLLTESDQYKKVAELPGVTRMLYAQYLAAGFTNPKYGIEKNADGRMRVDQSDIQLSTILVMQAGQNADFRESKSFKDTVAKLGEHLTSDSKTDSMLKSIADANNLTTSKALSPEQFAALSPEQQKQQLLKEKEAMLKEAVDTADTLGLKTLSGLRHDANFMSRQSEEVQKDIAATVDAAATARLEYMKVLLQQGKTGEAELVMAKAKDQDPRSIGQIKDGVANYTSNDWAQTDLALIRGSAPKELDLKTLQTMYNKKVEEGLFTSTNRGLGMSDKDLMANGFASSDVGADRILQAMKDLTTAQKEDRVQTVKAMSDEITALKTRLDGLSQKEFDMPERRAVEEKELKDQIAALERSKQDVETFGKQLSDSDDANRLLLSLSRNLGINEKGAARADLEALKSQYPELWNSIPEDKRNGIEEATVDIPWWKDWRVYAIGAAVIIGGIAGFGAGSAVTGALAGGAMATLVGGTVVATATGVVVGTAVGTGAGALTYALAHHGADAMGWSSEFDRGSTLDYLKTGAQIAAPSALMGATFGAFGAVSTVSVAGVESTIAASRGQAALNYIKGATINYGKMLPATTGGALVSEGTRSWATGQEIDWGNVATLSAITALGGKIPTKGWFGATTWSSGVPMAATGIIQNGQGLLAGSDYNAAPLSPFSVGADKYSNIPFWITNGDLDSERTNRINRLLIANEQRLGVKSRANDQSTDDAMRKIFENYDPFRLNAP